VKRIQVLTNQLSAAQVIRRTFVENLDVITSGPEVPAPAELLASPRLADFLDVVRGVYDVILIDSPPLLLTTEARALAMYMGQIVFVVRAGRTLQTAVDHALGTIEACPLKMMLLNQVRAEKRGIYGEYGLGYGYGYGYGHGPSKHGA